jgi:hypothetical protein
MKNLRYISAQPAIDYYTWQVEVMIHNFLKNGLNPNNIDIVCSIKNNHIPDAWIKLANHYNTVRFFFYNDDRENSVYISSIRPHILQKHFEKHPYLKDEAIMYHDCDIILTKPPQWDHLVHDDVWYLSDTRYYIGAEYIKSKKCGVYERMCEIVGISEDVPVQYEMHSGGAQYLMKNIDAAFWKKVYEDSEKLYQFFLDHLKAFPQTDKYHPIQKWTADMWAVLWNGWYFGHDTKVVDELEFTWPMHGLDFWEKCTIMHNAGVTGETADKDRTFFKGKYVDGKLPYNNITLENYNEKMCTYKYVQEILETAKTSCLL